MATELNPKSLAHASNDTTLIRTGEGHVIDASAASCAGLTLGMTLLNNAPVDESVRATLLLLRDLGYTHLDLSGAPAPSPASAAEVGGATSRAPYERGDPATETIVNALSIEELREIALPCLRCRLAGTRTQVVFGT